MSADSASDPKREGRKPAFLYIFKMASRGEKRGDGDKSETATKKTMYSCKFQQDWLKEYAFIARSHKGAEFAKCVSCGMDISIARGGKNDIAKHISSDNHKKNANALAKTPKITGFVTRGAEEADKVIYA